MKSFADGARDKDNAIGGKDSSIGEGAGSRGEAAGRSVRIAYGDREIIVPQGTLLSDALLGAGIRIEFPCGGRGRCGGCKVRFLEGAPEPTAPELKKLERSALESGVRLACQARVFTDARLDLVELIGRDLRKAGLSLGYDGWERTLRQGYGLAIDVGTTTVVGILADLSTGEPVLARSATNLQEIGRASCRERV